MSEEERNSRELCPPTEWSLIDRVRAEGIEGARPYLAELLTRYRRPMMVYLISQLRLTSDAAEDAVQGFVADKILNDGLINRADPARGRFRSLVFTALRHYTTDQIRQEKTAKRHPEGGELRSLNDGTEAAIIDGNPSAMFDVEWARSVLAEALRRTQDHCRQSGQIRAWEMLECRGLGPLLHGATVPPYEELVNRLGFDSPAEASNALATAKRIFHRMLESVIREYANDESDLDEEIRYLTDVLSVSSAR